MLGTFFAVFIFAKFSSLGDSHAYLSGSHAHGDMLSSRTALLGNLAFALKNIFGLDLFVHLLFSLASGFGLWLSLSFLQPFHVKTKKLLFIVLISPSFLVWSGVVSKEALVILPIGGLMYLYCRYLLGSFKVSSYIWFIIFVIMLLFIRPNFFPVYTMIFISTYIIMNKNLTRLSYGVLVLLMAICVSFILFYIINNFSFEIDYAIYMSKRMFLAYESDTNRYWVEWDSFSDYFYNMYWGIPFSIIGPLPSEAMNRVAFIPFLLEGIFYFSFIFYVDILLYKVAKRSSIGLKLFWIVLIPNQVFSLLLFYPLGVFNPGSALRYKQPLIYVLYILPLILREYLLIQKKGLINK